VFAALAAPMALANTTLAEIEKGAIILDLHPLDPLPALIIPEVGLPQFQEEEVLPVFWIDVELLGLNFTFYASHLRFLVIYFDYYCHYLI